MSHSAQFSLQIVCNEMDLFLLCEVIFATGPLQTNERPLEERVPPASGRRQSPSPAQSPPSLRLASGLPAHPCGHSQLNQILSHMLYKINIMATDLGSVNDDSIFLIYCNVGKKGNQFRLSFGHSSLEVAHRE